MKELKEILKGRLKKGDGIRINGFVFDARLIKRIMRSIKGDFVVKTGMGWIEVEYGTGRFKVYPIHSECLNIIGSYQSA